VRYAQGMIGQDEETHVQCELCVGTGGVTSTYEVSSVINGKPSLQYRTVHSPCWLCGGVGVLAPSKLVGWIRAGRPGHAPDARIVCPRCAGVGRKTTVLPSGQKIGEPYCDTCFGVGRVTVDVAAKYTPGG